MRDKYSNLWSIPRVYVEYYVYSGKFFVDKFPNYASAKYYIERYGKNDCYIKKVIVR